MARRSDTPANPDVICLGQIGAARGLKGEVRVTSYTDDPADLGAYGALLSADGSRTFEVTVTGRAKGPVVIARIGGVTDRTMAEALNGTRLYLPREALPAAAENEYYLADLVGLAAETVAGEALGKVTSVDDFGAGPVIEIEGPAHGVVMVPFTDAVVPTVDLEAGRMVIDPPVGLLEAAPEGDAAGDGGGEDA